MAETGKLSPTKKVRKSLADGTVKVYEYPRERQQRPRRQRSREADEWALFRCMKGAQQLLAYYEGKSLRAKAEGTSMMSAREFAAIAVRSRGRCEVTGIEFRFGDAERAYGPSLDRMSAGGPYSFENCRLVLLAVNVAMSNWGEDVFRDICAAFVTNALRRS